MNSWAGITLTGLLLLVASDATAGDMPRWVRTEGNAVVSAPPDMARVWIGVEALGATPTEALRLTSADLEKTLKTIRKAGVKKEDIQTGYLMVGSAQRYGAPMDPALPYRAYNSIDVQIRDLPRLGEILDQIVAGGASQLGSVRFAVADPRKFRDEAQRNALSDAHRRAELYAASGGFKVGQLLRVDEFAGRSGGGYEAMGAEEEIAVPATRSVPISPGTVDYTATVAATWELVQ